MHSGCETRIPGLDSERSIEIVGVTKAEIRNYARLRSTRRERLVDTRSAAVLTGLASPRRNVRFAG